MYFLDRYVIDWEKVKTLEDMKRLIAALDISFEPNSKNIDNIKDLVRLEKKPSQQWTID